MRRAKNPFPEYPYGRSDLLGYYLRSEKERLWDKRGKTLNDYRFEEALNTCDIDLFVSTLADIMIDAAGNRYRGWQVHHPDDVTAVGELENYLTNIFFKKCNCKGENK